MFHYYKIVESNLSKNYTYFKLQKDNKYYFMKKVRVVLPKTISSFNNEVSKYEIVNKLNIFPKMIEVDIDNLYIIYEYLDYFSKEEIMNFSYSKKIEVILNLIDNAIKLHANNIIHCDLKLSNIIITKDFKLYLLDLDHACFKGEVNNYGTLKYCSIEQLEGKNATYKFDMYAIGIVIYELLLNKKAFKGLNKEEVIEAKRSNQLLLDDELNKYYFLKDIISKTTNSDSSKQYNSLSELKKYIEKLTYNM